MSGNLTEINCSSFHKNVGYYITYLRLNKRYEKLLDEANEITNEEAMPDGQEEKCGSLGDVFIIQEFQPLEHIPWDGEK